eukprot:scaffold647945_cov47-Prasinocladus_malaysianus.AAC.1
MGMNNLCLCSNATAERLRQPLRDAPGSSQRQAARRELPAVHLRGPQRAGSVGQHAPRRRPPRRPPALRQADTGQRGRAGAQALAAGPGPAARARISLHQRDEGMHCAGAGKGQARLFSVWQNDAIGSWLPHRRNKQEVVFFAETNVCNTENEDQFDGSTCFSIIVSSLNDKFSSYEFHRPGGGGGCQQAKERPVKLATDQETHAARLAVVKSLEIMWQLRAATKSITDQHHVLCGQLRSMVHEVWESVRAMVSAGLVGQSPRVSLDYTVLA